MLINFAIVSLNTFQANNILRIFSSTFTGLAILRVEYFDRKRPKERTDVFSNIMKNEILSKLPLLFRGTSISVLP